MSKSIKALKIIEFILYGIALAISIFFVCYYRGSENSLYAVCYTLIGLGFLEIVLLLLRVIQKDVIKSLTSYIHVAYIVCAVLCYYILRHASHYDEFAILYWSLFLSITVIAIVVFVILNIKLKKNGSNITKKRL